MLSIGDKAPDFAGKDENGNKVSLSMYKGKKLILYFYPKDLTPGCTLQAISLSTNIADLNKRGYEVLGVSADSEKRHCSFIDKVGIKFHLLADEDMTIIKAYGVWGRKKFMGREYDGIIRKTFIIDELGNIERIIDKVKTKSHYEQIVEAD
jgi:peroxiredoxin Q/BCP